MKRTFNLKTKKSLIGGIALMLLATVLIFATPSLQTAYASAPTHTGDFIGISGDKSIIDANMFSNSNTYNYSVTNSGGFR